MNSICDKKRGLISRRVVGKEEAKSHLSKLKTLVVYLLKEHGQKSTGDIQRALKRYGYNFTASKLEALIKVVVHERFDSAGELKIMPVNDAEIQLTQILKEEVFLEQTVKTLEKELADVNCRLQLVRDKKATFSVG